jgi:hypothetical protein
MTIRKVTNRAITAEESRVLMKLRRGFVLIWILIGVMVVALAAIMVRALRGGQPAHDMLAFIGFIGVYMALGLYLGSIPCPRCHRPFFRDFLTDRWWITTHDCGLNLFSTDR